MALSYSLLLGAPAAVDVVAETMATADAAHRTTQGGHPPFDGTGVYLASGVFVSNRVANSMPYPDPVEEVFGFAPATTVRFRLAKGRDSQEQEQDIVRLVAAVLGAVDGDAVLAFERERTLLLRVAGLLTINTATDFWTPDLVALLPRHELAELADL